jgi:CO dehydrogenase/acetyl-CoA synthase delta subunit
MGLDQRLKTLERRVQRSTPRPVVIPAAEVNDQDQYRAILDASAMRADGRLALGSYLENMAEWQRNFLDTYGAAMVTLMYIGRKDNVDPQKAGSAGATC